MIRKQTITIENETQDFVWVVFLNHKENKIWRDYNDFHVFEDCEKARQWATKECYRLLNNIVSNMGVIPYKTKVEWYDEYNLSMLIFNKDVDGLIKLQDRTDIYIHKKNIL